MIEPWLNESAGESQANELLAEAALSISAVTAVIGWTFVKQLTVERKKSPLVVNGISFLLAGFMSLGVSSAIETWQPLPVFGWRGFLVSLFFIVVIHNLICYSIYADSLSRFSVTFMAFAGLSNPLFAASFGWAFLKETIPGSFWLAFIGIVTGLYLFHQAERSPIKTKLATSEGDNIF